MRKQGFLLLEVVLGLSLLCTVLFLAMLLYSTLLNLMLRHQIRERGTNFLEMYLCKTTPLTLDLTKRDLMLKITKKSAMPGLSYLEYQVFFQSETEPVCNMILYE